MDKTMPIEARIDKDVFAAIGLAIVTWSQLERAIGIQMMRVLRTQEMSPSDQLCAFVVTTGMDVRTMVGLLKSLVTVRFAEHADEFNKLADCILSAFTNRRNVLAHRAFGLGKKSNRIKVYDIVTVGQLKAKSHEITATEIRKWALDFFDLAHRLDGFLTARGLPPPQDIPVPAQSTPSPPPPTRA